MRINATKCAFEVSSRKFLGHLVMRRGIDTNLEQITETNDLVSSRTMKEVQTLTRMAIALNRFINKFSEKCCLFFQLIRKNIIFFME